VLAAGTYWVEWGSYGTLASGPWAPPVTVLGSTGTGNAKQNQAGLWVDVIDVGPQDFPFEVKGVPNAGSITCNVTLTPQSGDGTFDHTFDITNSTDSSVTADIWTELVDPHGARKEGKIITGQTLRSHRVYSKEGTTGLKANAPLGDYEFVVNVGTYPSSVLATASATYSKTSLRRTESPVAGLVSTPAQTSLLGNYPNPFNPSTTFRYGLSEPGQVSLKVYNMLGQLVRTVVEDHQVEGYHEAVWDGRNDIGSTVSSGIYIYRMTVGSVVETKRMILMK
jgi:hypothetical protein